MLSRIARRARAEAAAVVVTLPSAADLQETLASIASGDKPRTREGECDPRLCEVCGTRAIETIDADALAYYCFACGASASSEQGERLAGHPEYCEMDCRPVALAAPGRRTTPRFSGGRGGQAAHDSMHYQGQLCGGAKRSGIVLPAALVAETARRLSASSRDRKKKRTPQLVQRTLVAVAEEQGLGELVDLQTAARILDIPVSARKGGARGVRSGCFGAAGGVRGAGGVPAAATQLIGAVQEHLRGGESARALALLRADTEGPQRYQRWVAEMVAVGERAGIGSRRKLSTRVDGLVHLLLRCLGAVPGRAVAAAKGMRSNSSVVVAAAYAELWFHFRAVYDRAGVPYPPFVVGAAAAQRAREAAAAALRAAPAPCGARTPLFAAALAATLAEPL